MNTSIFFYLLKAWIIGIAIAAPVGPIGMLCIRKSLQLGLIGAISVGVGAALADAIYGLVAAAGVTAISGFLVSQSFFIKIAGGLFLLYLAYRELKAPPSGSAAQKGEPLGLLKLSGQTFLLTLTNPATILSFVGIFASIGGTDIQFEESAWMVIGIFLGSMTWWLMLGAAICKMKRLLPENWISRIRYISAAILAGFAALALLSALVP